MRLFMVPGMGHCGGGPGVNAFDSIGTLEKWVEKGIAPDTMLGTGAKGMTRPLCPYPQAAEYKGSGDLKDAATTGRVKRRADARRNQESGLSAGPVARHQLSAQSSRTTRLDALSIIR